MTGETAQDDPSAEIRGKPGAANVGLRFSFKSVPSGMTEILKRFAQLPEKDAKARYSKHLETADVAREVLQYGKGEKLLPLPPPLAYLYSHFPKSFENGKTVELIADYYDGLAQYRGRIVNGAGTRRGLPAEVEPLGAPIIDRPPFYEGRTPSELAQQLVHDLAQFGQIEKAAWDLVLKSRYRLKMALNGLKPTADGWEFSPHVEVHRLHRHAPLFRLDPWEELRTSTYLGLRERVRGCFVDGVGRDNELPPKGTRQLLVSSSQVRRGLRVAAEAWRNPSINNLLISAPPGSGKERLSQYVAAGHFVATKGRRQGKDEPTVSLAECRPEQVGQELCTAVARIEAPGPAPKAPKGAVILDEADKPQPPVRSALLRLLEARRAEWLGPAGRVEYDLKGVLFVVNVAVPIRVLRQEKGPIDFWTRIQRSVELAHPLIDSSPDVLESYLAMFFAMALEEFEDTGRGYPALERLGAVGQRFGALLTQDREGIVGDIAKHTASVVAGLVDISLPSIRDLRTVCARIVSELATDDLLRGSAPDPLAENLQASNLLGLLEALEAATGAGKEHLRARVSSALAGWCQRRVPALYLEQII